MRIGLYLAYWPRSTTCRTAASGWGSGCRGRRVSEGWHGVPFARPLARTREYVELVRRALAREDALESEGEEFRLRRSWTGWAPPRAD